MYLLWLFQEEEQRRAEEERRRAEEERRRAAAAAVAAQDAQVRRFVNADLQCDMIIVCNLL